MHSIRQNLKEIFLLIKNFLGAGVIISASVVCFVIILLSVFIYLPNNLQSPVTILIEPGKTTIEIASKLRNSGIIKSKWLFILYSKTIASNKKLIAGEYEFLPHKSLKEVVTIISKGESIIRKLTIPEGYTVWQILNTLNNETRLAGNLTETPDEGTLFPDTFYFRYGDLRSKILSTMQQQMNQLIKDSIPKLKPNSHIDNVQKLLTLASIVEKEAGNNHEKPIIASVFLNRLKKGMKLQADPTVIYAITMGRKDLGRSLTKSDLNIDSPYNTYKVKGLPPTPIACPGLKSIQAVLNPATTNYLYFVVDGNGGHNFSSTLEEHNKFVKEYRDRVSNSKQTN